MTALAAPLPNLARWPVSVAGQMADSYRLGVSMMGVCPALFAVILLPEFAQHVAEIRMGMFAPGDTIRPGRETEVRMAFGAVKVAGLLLGILLTLRFRLAGSDLRRTFSPDLRGVGRFALAFAAVGALDVAAPFVSTDYVPVDFGAARVWIDRGLDLLRFAGQALLLLWLIGTLGGDDAMTARRSIRLGLRNLPRLVILLPAAFLPLSLLHQQIHVWAKDEAPALVWTLMTIDSFVVGLLGTITASALYVFYRDAVAADRP